MRDLKVYIVVSQHFPASVGKLMVHAGHVISKMFFMAYQHDAIDLKRKIYRWYSSGQTKIILQIKNLDKLIALMNDISNNNDILTFIQRDAGAYEVPMGTTLMFCTEPITKEQATYTGLKKLRLYKYTTKLNIKKKQIRKIINKWWETYEEEYRDLIEYREINKEKKFVDEVLK
ncbi:hypothetical protein LCGC14_0224280 [marine sediment metagenome]|uniref:peptidyl-tRNA hydrolase n=1 Tax=marine sediment metagenome TaxID=412755 RepID=A0A0F9UCE4_9ZZZZ